MMGRHAVVVWDAKPYGLVVNPGGLAQHLYAKLGFEFGAWQNSLVLRDPGSVSDGT